MNLELEAVQARIASHTSDHSFLFTVTPSGKNFLLEQGTDTREAHVSGCGVKALGIQLACALAMRLVALVALIEMPDLRSCLTLALPRHNVVRNTARRGHAL